MKARGMLIPLFVLLICGLVAVPMMVEAAPAAREILFQTSTVGALMEGVYDGDVTFAELKKRGDFGLGTLNGLDGEVLGFDGEFYQIDATGEVHVIPDTAKTPFAAVTFFDADKSLGLRERSDWDGLQTFIRTMMPSENLMYAIKVEGWFRYVKTRSVPRQTKPYPRLAEVVKHQAIFEFRNVRGTLVGFWLPDYMQGVNVPGFHLHFLTDDRTGGGHLLDCQMLRGQVAIDYTPTFYMALPDTDEFYQIDLREDKRDELEKVEKD